MKMNATKYQKKKLIAIYDPHDEWSRSPLLVKIKESDGRVWPPLERMLVDVDSFVETIDHFFLYEHEERRYPGCIYIETKEELIDLLRVMTL